jgi:ubiquinone/menaquinone biosynthesis C-methylase UbiE
MSKNHKSFDKKTVMSANVKLHTLASDSYNTEPHFRPENQKRVENIIKDLKKRTHGNSLLDVGCGTGFIINIAKNHFSKIRGVDITKAMIDQVNTKEPGCDIQLKIADTDDLPYEDNQFDVCTAHATLHHLFKTLPTFKEVYRTLKPNGIFYSDLDPNYYFWNAISKLPHDGNYSDIVKREIDATIYKDRELAQQFKINLRTVQAAEHLKHVHNGFKEEVLNKELKQVGFTKVEIHYEWFLGEASIIHGEYSSAADTFRKLLQKNLPLSRHLFKYIRVIAQK